MHGLVAEDCNSTVTYELLSFSTDIVVASRYWRHLLLIWFHILLFGGIIHHNHFIKVASLTSIKYHTDVIHYIAPSTGHFIVLHLSCVIKKCPAPLIIGYQVILTLLHGTVLAVVPADDKGFLDDAANMNML